MYSHGRVQVIVELVVLYRVLLLMVTWNYLHFYFPSHHDPVQVVKAARTIEKCWCSFRDRQIFKLLKYAICAAVCTIFIYNNFVTDTE